MPIDITSPEDAEVLARAIKAGQVPPERETEVMDALRAWQGRKEQFESGELPVLDEERARFGIGEFEERRASPNVGRAAGRFAKDVGKDALAVAEGAGTILTGGAAEIGGGAVGALTLLGGFGNDEARRNLEGFSDFFTYSARSKRGQKLMNDVAVPLVALERAADRGSEKLSMGNPIAATTIKTVLLGGLELLAPAKGTTRSAVSARRQAKAVKEQTKALAEEYGISTDIDDMQVGIVQAAKEMTPEVRAQNAPALQQALIEANNAAKANKDALFEAAKSSEAFIETRSVRQFAAEMEAQLAARYDIEDLDKVQRRLNNLTTGEFAVGGKLATDLINLEFIRRRTNKKLSGDLEERAALAALRRGIDDFMNQQFNDAAISGDPSAVKAWTDARAAHAAWRSDFSSDKVIADLIARDATPETYRQWLTGASNMNARREAASTIKRMRKILGDDHPAIEGIRQDFLFEVAEPLLQETPNFRAFVRNYDATVRRNPSLVREMGLQQSNLNNLYRFAQVQNRLPPNKRLASGTDITRGLAQFFTGHKIAKASLRVNLTRNMANLLLGFDRVSKKRVLAELTDSLHGEIAIPRTSKVAAEFISGAALTGAFKDQDEDE